MNRLISYNFFYCSSLLLILISFCNANNYKETIHLNNGTIIKGEIIKKTEDGTITVQSGNNTFTFNDDEILAIKKTNQKKISNTSKNERIEAAKAYLKEIRERIATDQNTYFIDNNFYYMLNGGIAQEEQLNDIDYAASFLGFYWNIQDNILLGFNQTNKIKHIGNLDGTLPCENTYDGCDLWFYRRLYGISYIEFQKKIGDGLFWRIDAGYANSGHVDIANVLALQVPGHDDRGGIGILAGVGYGFNNLLLEFDYHLHQFDGDNISWWNFSIGKLFE